MKRAGVRRLRRNLAVAIGNSEDPGLAGALEAHAQVTCRDEMVREHVNWAVEKLRG
jgi:epoxyqueuosine reductase QueG